MRVVLSPRAENDVIGISAYTLDTWGERQMSVYVDGLKQDLPNLLLIRAKADGGVRSAVAIEVLCRVLTSCFTGRRRKTSSLCGSCMSA